MRFAWRTQRLLRRSVANTPVRRFLPQVEILEERQLLAALTFASNTVSPGGTGSRQVITGDFNGDGKADLVVANQGTANLGFLLGVGDGTFNIQAPIAVSFNNGGVAA